MIGALCTKNDTFLAHFNLQNERRAWVFDMYRRAFFFAQFLAQHSFLATKNLLSFMRYEIPKIRVISWLITKNKSIFVAKKEFRAE